MILPPLLLAEGPNVNVVTVPPMEGVTTAIVLFIFVCIAMPSLVKHKTQFYGAFIAVLGIIFLHSLNIMFGGSSAGFQIFAGSLIGLLQIGAILLLFMSCGGVGLREVAGEMSRAYEVIRRGEEEKEVIIPIGGEMPKPRQQPAETIPPARTPEAAPPAQKIDLPPEAGWPKKSGDSSIPLE